ncbi:hypothetical protein [Desulfosporosinus youngiae]|uniref:Uncharacterized protein n=1 Tax=Desulfosporosinus youngiae DSM 17734 TaxID=768710 RepID=H5Y565_9FIRM|nr:hypothetical protein [Desulfosporosinus youngiae]EHQ90169.1 hypothetical protein DesyoDRAFT_3135 [Desulfosporosinus youngiae DSM 17734]
MKIIRNYLLNDLQLKTLLDNQNAIYLVEKPKEMENNTYIIYFYKTLTGGFIKDYQVEFRLISKDLSKLIAIQSRLINLLDDPRGKKIIKDTETVIRSTKLLNGGGMVKNESTGNYEVVVYFLCQI